MVSDMKERKTSAIDRDRSGRSHRALIIAAFLSSVACAASEAAMAPIERTLAVQRACQAAIWGMPAVGIYDVELSTSRDLGGRINDVVYFSEPMKSRHGFLTANNVTPYVVGSLSTKDGPLVVEVPPAGDKASFFGTFVDAWDAPIEDVGPPGADKGQGARYLFLPPGYEGSVPEGYLVYRPLTYSVNFAFRPVARNGGTHADRAAYAQTLKVYPLEQAASPPRRRASSMPTRRPGICCPSTTSVTFRTSMLSSSGNRSSSVTRP